MTKRTRRTCAWWRRKSARTAAKRAAARRSGESKNTAKAPNQRDLGASRQHRHVEQRVDEILPAKEDGEAKEHRQQHEGQEQQGEKVFGGHGTPPG